MSLDRKLMEMEREKLIAKLTAPHRQPPGAEGEMVRQAAWSRLKSQLDADGGSLKFMAAHNILKRAAEINDSATLEAARRELPNYLPSKNESLPREITVWLDMQAGTNETVAARVIEMADAGDHSAAFHAVRRLDQAAQKREVPDFMPSPTGIEGQRIEWLTGDDE